MRGQYQHSTLTKLVPSKRFEKAVMWLFLQARPRERASYIKFRCSWRSKKITTRKPSLCILPRCASRTSTHPTLLHFRKQALAQDQKASLEQLIFSCPGLSHLRVATYDGDTPQDARTSVYNSNKSLAPDFVVLIVRFSGQRDSISDFHQLRACGRGYVNSLDLLLNFSKDTIHASILPHEDVWRRCATVTFLSPSASRNLMSISVLSRM